MWGEEDDDEVILEPDWTSGEGELSQGLVSGFSTLLNLVQDTAPLAEGIAAESDAVEYGGGLECETTEDPEVLECGEDADSVASEESDDTNLVPSTQSDSSAEDDSDNIVRILLEKTHRDQRIGIDLKTERGALRVARIDPQSPLAYKGSPVRVGSRVLEINGVAFDKKPDVICATQLILSAERHVSIAFERTSLDTHAPVPQVPHGPLAVTPTVPEGPPPIQPADNVQETHQQDDEVYRPGDMLCVGITKLTPDQSLGIGMVVRDGRLWVADIVKGGALDGNSPIEIGDAILSINQVDFQQNPSVSLAGRTIQQAQSEVAITIQKGPSSVPAVPLLTTTNLAETEPEIPLNQDQVPEAESQASAGDSQRQRLGETFAVVATKTSREQKMGMSLTVRNGALWIAKIAPTSPLAGNSPARVGDRVLEINGVSFRDQPDGGRALGIIKAALGEVVITLQKSSAATAEMNAAVVFQQNQPAPRPGLSRPTMDPDAGSHASGANGGYEPGEVYAVVVTKTSPTQSLGLRMKVTGGALRVAGVAPGSPLDGNCPIEVMDTILEINGVSFTGNPDVTRAVQVVKQAQSEVALTLERAGAVFAPSSSSIVSVPTTYSSVGGGSISNMSGLVVSEPEISFSEQHGSGRLSQPTLHAASASPAVGNGAGDVYRVSITKTSPNQPLGLSLKTRDGYLYVSRLASNSPFAANSSLRVNDKILEINGVSFRDQSDGSRAVQILKAAVGEVTIVLEKMGGPQSSDPPSVSSSQPSYPGAPSNAVPPAAAPVPFVPAAYSEDRTDLVPYAGAATPYVPLYQAGASPPVQQGVPFRPTDPVEAATSSSAGERGEVFRITVTKTTPGQRLGLSMRNNNGVLRVSQIKSESSLAGSPIAVGDKIIEINGVSFQDCPNVAEASQVINRAERDVVITFEKSTTAHASSDSIPSIGNTSSPGLPLPGPEPAVSSLAETGELEDAEDRDDEFRAGEVFSVALTKTSPDQSVGLTMKNQGGVLRVFKIAATSPLAGDSPIEVGDTILEINGVKFQEQPDAVRAGQILQNADGEVVITVQKASTVDSPVAAETGIPSSNPEQASGDTMFSTGDVFTVTVTKSFPSQAMGLTMYVHNGMLRISGIAPDSPLADDTPIRVGDRIVEINGVSFQNRPDVTAATYLMQNAEREVVITIEKIPTPSSLPPACQPSTETVHAIERPNRQTLPETAPLSVPPRPPQRSSASSMASGAAQSTGNTSQPGETFTVSLTKEFPQQKLGVAFKSQGGELRVSRIAPESPLASNSPIQVGDTVVSINGQSFRHQPSARSALEVIRRSPREVVMKLERGTGSCGFIPSAASADLSDSISRLSGADAESISNTHNSGGVFSARVSKQFPQQDVGVAFTVQDGALRLTSIAPGSPAATNPSLQVGDTVISINDISFKSQPSAALAEEIIQRAARDVVFQLERTSSFEHVTCMVTKAFPEEKAGIGMAVKGGSLLITKIVPSGLFANTQAAVGDKILSINGKSFRSNPSAREALAAVRASVDTITVRIECSGPRSSNIPDLGSGAPGQTAGVPSSQVPVPTMFVPQVAATMVEAQPVPLTISAEHASLGGSAPSSQGNYYDDSKGVATPVIPTAAAVAVAVDTASAYTPGGVPGVQHGAILPTHDAPFSKTDPLEEARRRAAPQQAALRPQLLSVTVVKTSSRTFAGIGVQVSFREGRSLLCIAHVAPNGLFAGAGIEAGDLLWSLNGDRFPDDAPDASFVNDIIQNISGYLTLVVQKANGNEGCVSVCLRRPPMRISNALDLEVVDERLRISNVDRNSVFCHTPLNFGFYFISINGIDCRYEIPEVVTAMIDSSGQEVVFVASSSQM